MIFYLKLTNQKSKQFLSKKYLIFSIEFSKLWISSKYNTLIKINCSINTKKEIEIKYKEISYKQNRSSFNIFLHYFID